MAGGTYLSVEKQNGEASASETPITSLFPVVVIVAPPYNKDIGHNSKNTVGQTPSSAEHAVAQAVLLYKNARYVVA
jgi:hypothetical protein